MQVVMNNSLVYYGDKSPIGGDVALSAMGIVMKIAMIMGAFGIGVGIGAQPILGYNRGCRKIPQDQRDIHMGAAAATVLIFLGWIVCQTKPEAIIGLFGRRTRSLPTLRSGASELICSVSSARAFRSYPPNYFQATGQPLKASLLSMLRQLLPC